MCVNIPGYSLWRIFWISFVHFPQQVPNHTVDKYPLSDPFAPGVGSHSALRLALARAIVQLLPETPRGSPLDCLPFSPWQHIHTRLLQLGLREPVCFKTYAQNQFITTGKFCKCSIPIKLSLLVCWECTSMRSWEVAITLLNTQPPNLHLVNLCKKIQLKQLGHWAGPPPQPTAKATESGDLGILVCVVRSTVFLN